MPKQARRKGRLGKTLLSLLAAAAIGVIAWGYISPLLATGSETIYESYTAQTGTVQTHKSFAASINVLNSETHNNEMEVTSIRTLYVKSGQKVKDGDKLFQLSTGKIYRAGIDGTVNDMRFGVGDWLWPRVQIIQISDLEHLEVSLSVDEYDVDKVAAGQKCTVTIVPLGLDFETEIKHVNRLSSATGNVAYYEVTAELTVPENVLPGMTASVSIPADCVENAVTLDMAALSFNEEKQPYVLVKNGEVYEQRLLETGLSDGMKVEIKSGLSAGDTVYRSYEQEIQTEGFTLAALYKKLVGEKVVINDRTGSGRGGMSGMMPGAMPSGMQLPEGMTLPEGFTPPEGMESPEGMERPEGMESPEGTASQTNQRPGGEQQ